MQAELAETVRPKRKNHFTSVTTLRFLCNMADGHRMFGYPRTGASVRYLYDDDGTTRFGGGTTYNLRSRAYTRGTYGRRWHAKRPNYSGPEECSSGCGRSDKTGTGGGDLPIPPKKEKPDSPSVRESEPECPLLKPSLTKEESPPLSGEDEGDSESSASVQSETEDETELEKGYKAWDEYVKARWPQGQAAPKGTE